MNRTKTRFLRTRLLLFLLGIGLIAALPELGWATTVLIRFKDGVLADRIKRFEQSKKEQGLLTSWEPRNGIFLADMGDRQTPEQILKELREDPSVADVSFEVTAPAPGTRRLPTVLIKPNTTRLSPAITDFSLDLLFDGSAHHHDWDVVLPADMRRKTSTGVLARTGKPPRAEGPAPDILLGKARFFEQVTQEHLTRYNLIGTSGDSAIWSGMYVASLAYRYSATKDPAALRQMEKSLYGFHAMSDISHAPGVFARVIDCRPRVPGKPLPNYLHEGMGKYKDCVWEGGGSFDQYLGYLYGIAEAWPLIQDPKLRDLIREDVRQIGLNFIRNDAKIIGPDTHLDSSPHYYYVDRWPKSWRWLNFLTPLLPDRSGNATGGLHIMKVASFVTGDPRFDDYYYKELIGKRHYDWYVEHKSAAHTEMLIEKNLWWMNALAKRRYGADVIVTADSMRGGGVGTNLSHVELYDLSRLEKDPEIRRTYLRGLSDLHETIADESNTFWNFLAGAQLGLDDKAVSESRDSLWRFPMDIHRKSITVPNAPQYKTLEASLLSPKNKIIWFAEKPLPFEARTVHSFAWQHNPRDMTGLPSTPDDAGGSAYLIAYWLGRSLGVIP